MMTEGTERGISHKTDFLLLSVFLVLGLIHGLIYVFIVPPWQHYDEPTHFEVVWLTAKLGRHPTVEDYDPAFSREVTQSMIDHGFFAGLPYSPDLSVESEVHIFGYQQFQEPPLYYYLAALPLKLYQSENVANELLATRLVSVVLFLATIVAAWGTVRTITPPGHPLRWMVPAFVVLLPAFTDLMSAVNNDAMAIAAFSFFFWIAVRILRFGFSLHNVFFLLLSLAVIFFTKNTAYVAFLLLPLVLIVSLFPITNRKYVWPILFLLLITGIVSFLRWDDASFWHRATTQKEPLRQVNSLAIHGEHVLVLNTQKETHPAWAPSAYQLLPLKTGDRIKENVLTFGVWMWADHPAKVNLPAINISDQSYTKLVELSEQPKFFAIQLPFTKHTGQMWINFNIKAPKEENNRYYYDGFILADGEFPIDEIPKFADESDSHGTWGGNSFTNFIRNGSIEKRWPRFETQLDKLGARVLPDNILPTLVLNAVLDWSGTKQVFRMMSWHQLKTFWAVFGWGHVQLKWPFIYHILLWITLIGLLGSIGMVISYRREAMWDPFWIAVCATIFFLAAYWARAIGYYVPGDFYFAPARHIYPGIIPILILICFGWITVARLMVYSINKIKSGVFQLHESQSTRASVTYFPIPALIYMILFVSLAVVSIISIFDYYY